MTTKKTKALDLKSLGENLQRLAEKHGLTLKQKFVGAVKVGDYLIYETERHAPPPNPHDRLIVIKEIHCRRVIARGGEQGSGPTPGYDSFALEGDERIRKYTHNRDRNVFVLVPKDEFT